MRIQCIYKIRFLKWFHIQAITLYPFIFFADSKPSVPMRLFRHELEHIYQVQRLGWWRFYFFYLKFYFSYRKQGLDHHQAYFKIPFEVEARQSEAMNLTAAEIELIEGKRKIVS